MVKLEQIINKSSQVLQDKANFKQLSFDTKGFWIKQSSEQKYLIINASKIDEKLNILFNLNIFVYDNLRLVLTSLSLLLLLLI